MLIFTCFPIPDLPLFNSLLEIAAIRPYATLYSFLPSPMAPGDIVASHTTIGAIRKKRHTFAHKKFVVPAFVWDLIIWSQTFH